jgi:hypothetical protein
MQFKELSGNLGIQITVPYIAAGTGANGGGTFVAPYALQIVSATWTASAAIAGTATNFFTLSFFNRGAAGSGTVQWATAIAYSSSGVTAAKAVANALTMSSTASDLLVAAGDVLNVESVSTLTGLTNPGGVVMLNARFR